MERLTLGFIGASIASLVWHLIIIPILESLPVRGRFVKPRRR